MCSQNTYLIINSIGLFSDIIGAFFVSSEVVKEFKGKKFNEIDVGNAHLNGGDDLIRESPEYQSFEKNKYTNMKIGLVFLVIGFLLQIISNVLQVIFH
jgi:hypothetical protein